MNIVFTEEAKKEYTKLDKSVKENFKKHIKKISEEKINRRHLKFGLPFFIENVGVSSRIAYKIEENRIIIYHFFPTHKEYENLYKNYKW